MYVKMLNIFLINELKIQYDSLPIMEMPKVTNVSYVTHLKKILIDFTNTIMWREQAVKFIYLF